MSVQWKAKNLRLELAAKLGRDVTQDEVSRSTGLAISRISAIENNKTRGVEFDTLVKLARFYHVRSVADLIEFENGIVVMGEGEDMENYKAEVEGTFNTRFPLPPKVRDLLVKNPEGPSPSSADSHSAGTGTKKSPHTAVKRAA